MVLYMEHFCLIFKAIENQLKCMLRKFDNLYTHPRSLSMLEPPGVDRTGAARRGSSLLQILQSPKGVLDKHCQTNFLPW